MKAGDLLSNKILLIIKLLYFNKGNIGDCNIIIICSAHVKCKQAFIIGFFHNECLVIVKLFGSGRDSVLMIFFTRAVILTY